MYVLDPKWPVCYQTERSIFCQPNRACILSTQKGMYAVNPKSFYAVNPIGHLCCKPQKTCMLSTQ